MLVSINIVGFHDVGINAVVIYKVLNTENSNHHYYIIEETDFAPCKYYKIINDDDSMDKLISELINTGSVITFNNETNKYELSGYKVYDITAENRQKGKFIIDMFDTNPINQEITFNDFDDNNIIHYSYEQYFQVYQQEGFPVV